MLENTTFISAWLILVLSLFMLAVSEVMVVLGFQKCFACLLRKSFEVMFEGICLAHPSRVKLVGNIMLDS